MIPTKPNIRLESPTWVFCAAYILTALPLAGATTQELPHIPEPEQKRNQEDIDKTLGCLIGTRNTYTNAKNEHIDHNLRHHIASFMAPEESYDFPIDFLAHATIIPKRWGNVCDIKRSPDGSLKILTCKDTHIFNPDRIGFSLLSGVMSVLLAKEAYNKWQCCKQEAVHPWSYNKTFTIGKAVLGGLCYGIISSVAAYISATSLCGKESFGDDVNHADVRDISAVEIATYDLTTQRKETAITIKKSTLEAGRRTHAYFLSTIRTIEVIRPSINSPNNISFDTFNIQPSGKVVQITSPEDPTSKAIRKSHLMQFAWEEMPENNNTSNWIDNWSVDGRKYLALSHGVPQNLLPNFCTDLNFDFTSLAALDEHEPVTYSMRHGISTHVLHGPHLNGYGARDITHINIMKLTGISQGMRFLSDEPDKISLNQFVTTDNIGEQIITRKIHLPHMIAKENIYAPLKSADSNAVALKISKQSFNTGNAQYSEHVTVVLDLKKQALSPQLKIMIENIIKSRSSEGCNKNETSKFSLRTFGSQGQRILENLGYFYDVDKERLATEKTATFWRKTTTYAAIGALGLGILYNKLHCN